MLERNTLQLTLNSLGKEAGIDGVAVYDLSGELLGKAFTLSTISLTD